jgi:transposase InsO family protein
VFQEHLVLHRIREIRRELPRTGCIKLHHSLNNGFFQALGIYMGRDAIFDLMRSNGMLVKPKKRYAVTTNSFHRFKVYPDLVQRRHGKWAEDIWVSDITYISTITGFTYLSLVTDAYSRKIVGYHLSADLKASGCIKALDHALQRRIYPNRPLIHHSDRGTQYCCDDYVSVLRSNKIGISMTQTGSPYDNAIAERVNGILKSEFDLYKTFRSHGDAGEVVADAIHRYNNLRLHASCGYQTPEYTHTKAKNEKDPLIVNRYHEKNLLL